MKYPLSSRYALSAAALALGLAASPASAALNPDADAILQSMSKFMGATKSFSVSADISNEIVTLEGQKLQMNASSNIVVERPSRLYMSRQGRFADGAVYYDGAKFSLASKTFNVYVQKDFSGGLDKLFNAIEQNGAMPIPGADLLLSSPYAALSSGVISSGYYGRAFIGGVECDHIAFRTATTDWQLWVKVGDQPVPMKYVITTKWTTAAPQYSAQFSNWNLKPKIAADQFKFSPAKGATKLDSLPTDETGELIAPKEGK